jgi:nucleoside-diphosphate-sugar epimerase
MLSPGERERMARNKALVVGALGLVGRAAVELLDTLEDWEVIGVSRRKPDWDPRAAFLSVDLRDRAACERTFGELRGVTHLIYTALYEAPRLGAGWNDPKHSAINLEMLRNTLEPLERGSPGLRHVTVLQGTKAYGVQQGPSKTPAKESDPRYLPPNFYYAQEDFLRERQRGRDWVWTALRPQLVCGYALGSPNNGIAALGAFAAICRELGVPLRYPGGSRIIEATDTGLLARACLWAGTTEACANEAYNITNGDVFVWSEVWPRIAALFGMEVGSPHPISLASVMADKAPVWERIRARHGLRCSLEELVPTWEFADLIFAWGSHPALGASGGGSAILVSTIKARQAGFADCLDSEQMFLDRLAEYQQRGALPH